MNSSPITLKKASIFSSVFLSVFFCSAKVRLNEISTSLQFAKKQWIELYVGSGDILDNKVLVNLKSSATDSEFCFFSLSGNSNENGSFFFKE